MKTIKVSHNFWTEIYMSDVEVNDGSDSWHDDFSRCWSEAIVTNTRAVVSLDANAAAYLVEVIPLRLIVWRDEKNAAMIRTGRRVVAELTGRA